MSDLIYGIVTLPDGRECKAMLWGINHPAPDGFEERESDPLEIEWMDGTELTVDEYEREYIVDGCYRTLSDLVIDGLFKDGTFEPWDMTED